MQKQQAPHSFPGAARIPINVQTYAGYKGDERPVSFSHEGWVCQVLEIVDRWYDPDYNGFRVLVDDGRTLLLQHDLNCDTWELVTPRHPVDGT